MDIVKSRALIKDPTCNAKEQPQLHNKSQNQQLVSTHCLYLCAEGGAGSTG